MTGEDLAALGEFGLIERIRARLGEPSDGVLVGPGDDAAVLTPPSRGLVATTDMFVEGVHFDLELSPPLDVGFKSIAASCSDIAAMGGRPQYALLSLGATSSTPVETIDGLYKGIDEAQRELGVRLAGGDVVSSEKLVLSVTVLGEQAPGGSIRRAGAQPGDLACVTGELGAAAAGLALLRAVDDAAARDLLAKYPALAEAYRRGRARIREGQRAAEAGVGAMIDVSDGLAADLGHVCDESGVGIEVRAADIPLAPGVPEVASWVGEQAERWALGGGEDYELAIAVAPQRFDTVQKAVAPTRLTVIGTFLAGDKRAGIESSGWDHFRRGSA
jgi:thiamine-monophosphate kinase